ncbi:MAG: hypothetical protein Q9191_000792 [Dirinaria sp. TL-2023a]
MDQRHQTPNHDPHAFRTNYTFNNNSQNDQFNTFLSGDNESSFSQTWDTGAFAETNDSLNTFSQPNQTWQSNNFQQPPFSIPDYGISGRQYDQIYSRTPQSFDYTGFGSHAQQTLSTPAYDPKVGYQLPLGNQPQYTFSPSQNYQNVSSQSQTISPQALQHYPTPYSQPAPQKPQQQYPVQSNLTSAQRGIAASGNVALAPLDSQGWRSIVANLPGGISRRAVLVRDAATLSTSANAKKLKGSSFLSNNTVDLATTKEKGTGPWNLAREPVRKKLKVAGTGSNGPRSSTSLRETPTNESASSAESSSESGSEDDSDYDSGSTSEDEITMEEPSPLPPTRPSDPDKATEYDIIKAVWAKRNVVLSSAVIISALGEYWEIIKGIRDRWKSEGQSLQQAIDKKETTKTTEYRNRVDGKRRLLESCIRLTLKHGHKDIIERLGENPIMFVVLSQFLIDRTKENEYTGSFVTSILELMNRWLKIDQETLEKTKLDKLLPKLMKRGDAVVQDLAHKVLEKSGLTLDKAVPDGKAIQPQATKISTTNKSPVEGPRSSEPGTGTKRPRLSDPSAAPQTKKQAGSANSVSNAPKQMSLLDKRRQQAAKLDPKAAGKPSTTPAATEKVKTNHISAKPSAFFSSLQSASKKSSASKSGPSMVKGKDKLDATRVADGKGVVSTATSKPAFSFAETMANLNKSRDEAPIKIEESRPAETPEEKRKRLRKEQRRKLRVSFKPDNELTEIRLLEHDPEEELGHDDSMVRDVKDRKGEGQMLKMHKDLDLMDEDDDDYEPAEELPITWFIPTGVDFSVIEDGELERNCITRGGKVEVDSPEKGIQEQREMTKLLAVYPSLSDIPSSPREPQEFVTGELPGEETLGAPSQNIKDLEAEYYAARNAQQQQQQQQATAPMQGQMQTSDVSALLKLINSRPQAQQPHPPQPATQAPASGLEAIFAQFSQQQQQTPQAPMQPVTQQPPAYNLQAALAAMHMPNQVQPAYASTPQNQQPNLQTILAQFNQQPQAPMHNYGYSNAYQGGNDRKRQAEHDDQSNGNFGFGQGKRQKGPEKKMAEPADKRILAAKWLVEYHKHRSPAMPTRRWFINHLIIVCCHAICLPGPGKGSIPLEWLIEDFQDPGETATFVQHIKTGLQKLSENRNSLLVFSGGPTKKDRTELSEAASYFALTDRNNVQWAARANEYYQIPLAEPEVSSHIVTEDAAVDSYQNLLFSILRYYTILRRWPKHITLISHDFKKRRFIELHCRAIRWPLDRFTFVGIDPPEDVVPRLDLDIGEENKGFGSWQKDPYAAQLFLQDKREDRGWTEEQLLEVCHSGIPRSVGPLVFWRGGETKCEWYAQPLPWTK